MKVPRPDQTCKATALKAFSLVELLTVLAILSILAVVGSNALQSMLSGSGVGGALNIASSLVSGARTEALFKATGSRLVIDADPNSDGYLRRMAVFRGVDENGEMRWELAARPVSLPPNTFVDDQFTTGYGEMLVDFKAGKSQDGTSGKRVIYFEYSPEGHLSAAPSSAAQRIVFAPGFIEEQGGSARLVVPEAKAPGRDGLILRRFGSVTYIGSPVSL